MDTIVEFPSIKQMAAEATEMSPASEQWIPLREMFFSEGPRLNKDLKGQIDLGKGQKKSL